MKTDPFEQIGSIHEEMERLFSDLYGWNAGMLPEKTENGNTARTPVTGMRETESAVIATFELPGISKDDIELNVAENSIEIKAEKKREKEEKTKNFRGFSSASRSFYRKIPVPMEIKADQSTAECKDGILEVTMPKQGAKKAKIEIK